MRSLLKEEKRARIYFVRHAESNNNVVQASSSQNYDDLRVPDPLLSDKGYQQAQACSKYLRKKGINPRVVFSSCFTRALETAKFIQKEFNCEGQIIREIHEIGGLNHQGKGFKGEGKKFFEENYPTFKLDESIREDGWYFHEKKETAEQAIERVKKMINKILEICHKCEEDNKKGIIPDFVFVTHGNFLDIIVGMLLHRQPGAMSFIQHNNTAITGFDVTVKDHFFIKFLNDFNHLEELHIETNEMTQSINCFENLTLKQHQSSQPTLKKVNSQF